MKILGALLILTIIPGYAISLTLFPQKSGLSMTERLVLSGILSIGTVIGGAVFMDSALGIDTTPANLIIFLSAVTATAVIVWRMELAYRRWSATRGSDQGFQGMNVLSRYLISRTAEVKGGMMKWITTLYKRMDYEN